MKKAKLEKLLNKIESDLEQALKLARLLKLSQTHSEIDRILTDFKGSDF